MRYLDLLVKLRVNKALLHIAKQMDLHRGFCVMMPALSLAPPSHEATPDMINCLDLLWTSEDIHDGLCPVERMRIWSLMLGPMPVRGVERYPYKSPDVVGPRLSTSLLTDRLGPVSHGSESTRTRVSWIRVFTGQNHK